ncbi:carboxypeptidase regulatory-like domain-containing protein [Bacteroidota bacterium]
MTRKILLVILAFAAINGLFAQSSILKGTVMDKDTKWDIPFATIIVLSDGDQIASKKTNFSGEYEINPMPVGRFTLVVRCVSYDVLEIKEFLVKADTVYYQHFELSPLTSKEPVYMNLPYKIPIIDTEHMQTGETITTEQIKRMSSRRHIPFESAILKGKVADKSTGEPIPFAKISIMDDGVQVKGAHSEFNGEYLFVTAPIGTYILKVSSVGYNSFELSDFLIKADTVIFQDFELIPLSTDQIDEVVKIAYKIPLIDKDNTIATYPIRAEGIEKMPGRKVYSVASTLPAVSSKSKRERRRLMKKNYGSKVFLVDGVRVSGVKEVNSDRGIGTLKGTIVDKETKKSIPHAVVQLYQHGISKHESPTDSDGKFSINKIKPGKYTLYARLAGYKILKLKNFRIRSKKIHVINFKLPPSRTRNKR